MTPPHGAKQVDAEEVAKLCRAECFGPDGPGSEIKATVDKWSGGISVGVWVAGLTMGLLAITVTVLIFAFPRMVRSEVSEEFDRRLGKGVTLTPQKLPASAVVQEIPESPWWAVPRGVPLVFSQAHAETKGSTP